MRLEVGQKVEQYYRNGKLHNIGTVTKVTDKSCWIDGWRESWLTIDRMFKEGLYKLA